MEYFPSPSFLLWRSPFWGKGKISITDPNYVKAFGREACMRLSPLSCKCSVMVDTLVNCFQISLLRSLHHPQSQNTVMDNNTNPKGRVYKSRLCAATASQSYALHKRFRSFCQCYNLESLLPNTFGQSIQTYYYYRIFGHKEQPLPGQTLHENMN